MDQSLKGRVVLVTGGVKGIGAAIVARFVRRIDYATARKHAPGRDWTGERRDGGWVIRGLLWGRAI